MGEKLKFPFTWRELTDEEKVERKKLFQHPLGTANEGVIVSQPGNLVFPKGYRDIAEEIYNMELRPDDVWVVTYPKCGTTWTQEMVWQIRHNFDLEGGKAQLNVRVPFVESQMLLDPDMDYPEEFKKLAERERFFDSVAYTKQLPSPRCIKTHLPLTMLPPKLLDTCKVVFVARYPKDCCVSYYNHERLIPMHGFTGEFSDYAKLFKDGNPMYGDYWYHLELSWKHRNHPNAYFMWFEDMKKDLTPFIRDLAKFMNRHLTELKVLQIDDHLYFDNFKKNPAVNNDALTNKETGLSFIRKGKVGDWKNYFSAEITKEWEEWIAQKKAKHGIDYKFGTI